MTTEKIAYLNVADIRPNPYQPRREFDEKSLEDLAQSIDVNGLIQPITVREIKTDDAVLYELVAGERRLRAIRDVLGKTRIKAIIQLGMTDSQSESIALVENIQREDLNPIEVANAIVALMKKDNLTQEQVAKRVGKPRVEISNLVRLVNLPEDVQDLIAIKKLSSSAGYKMAAISDLKLVSKLAHQTVDHGWTMEKLRKEIEKLELPPNKKATRKASIKRVPISEQTKLLVLVEFDNDEEAFNEFVAYLIEQKFSCFTGSSILERLEAKSLAKEPETENIADIFEEEISELDSTEVE